MLACRYVGPYIALSPELSFVLEDAKVAVATMSGCPRSLRSWLMARGAQGVCGYVLGALDSPTFYRRVVDEWFPALRAAHPLPPSSVRAAPVEQTIC
jgi:hypothetical protein